MPLRIRGVNIPDKKQAQIALTEIYGIGRARSNEILKAVSINGSVKIKDLTSEEEQKLRDYVEKNFTVEGELRREVAQNIKHLKDVGSYRGSRHAKHLPVRGQRTKTNTRTVRGNVRRTAGSGRRAPAGKT
jgi:small subunit ribosomal protein S13